MPFENGRADRSSELSEESPWKRDEDDGEAEYVLPGDGEDENVDVDDDEGGDPRGASAARPPPPPPAPPPAAGRLASILKPQPQSKPQSKLAASLQTGGAYARRPRVDELSDEGDGGAAAAKFSEAVGGFAYSRGQPERKRARIEEGSDGEAEYDPDQKEEEEEPAPPPAPPPGRRREAAPPAGRRGAPAVFDADPWCGARAPRAAAQRAMNKFHERAAPAYGLDEDQFDEEEEEDGGASRKRRGGRDRDEDYREDRPRRRNRWGEEEGESDDALDGLVDEEEEEWGGRRTRSRSGLRPRRAAASSREAVYEAIRREREERFPRRAAAVLAKKSYKEASSDEDDDEGCGGGGGRRARHGASRPRRAPGRAAAPKAWPRSRLRRTADDGGDGSGSSRSDRTEDEDEEGEDDGDLLSKPHTVERIIARRKFATSPDGERSEWRYLVKYKDESYLRVKWYPEDVVEGTTPHDRQRLRRFIDSYEKHHHHHKTVPFGGEVPLDEYVKPEHITIDRILSSRGSAAAGASPQPPAPSPPPRPEDVKAEDGVKMEEGEEEEGVDILKAEGEEPAAVPPEPAVKADPEDAPVEVDDPPPPPPAEAGAEGEPEAETEEGPVVRTRKKRGRPSPQDEGPPEPLAYLVKWRGSGYENSTWELAEDLAQLPEFSQRLAEFLRIAETNPYDEAKARKKERLERIGGGIVDLEGVVPDFGLAFRNGNELREYQSIGVKWLANNYIRRHNAILADEMGLGKTVQSVAFLEWLRQDRCVGGPFLVVAPLSTIPNWEREFRAWSDMYVVVYHGTALGRQSQRDTDWFNQNRNDVRYKHTRFHALVTTPEVLLQDASFLKELKWKCTIFDEGHKLKNKDSKLAICVREMRLNPLVLLTGTPIQNNTEELFNLLSLIDPNEFSNREEFLQAFGEMKDAEQVERLHARIKPYLLRRLKEDVEKSLLPKEECVIEIELTTLQKRCYRSVLDRNFDHLAAGAGSRQKRFSNLMNVMMELRKVCNHPYLLDGVEDVYINSLPEKHEKAKEEALVMASGKTVLLDKLLPKLKRDGHRVLIFSQMVRVLDILEDFMNIRGFSYERLDGTVTGPERQAGIDRFCAPGSEIFCFLLCTKAGGVGINLTAADTVIIFDSDWNPQNDLQAQARCHRIGQKKEVKIYRFVTRNSYERQLFERASMKLGLDEAVLQNINRDGQGEKQSSKQPLKQEAIDALLKRGAYDCLREEGDESARAFQEADIEQILERNMKVISTAAAGPEGGAPRPASFFSTATFTASSAEADCDVNDPDFWKKLLASSRTEGAKADDPLDAGLRASSAKTKSLREGGSDAEYESDDGSEAGGKRRRARKGDWTQKDRKAVVRGVGQYGYGRAAEFPGLCDITSHSGEDCEAYARSILRTVLAPEAPEVWKRLTAVLPDVAAPSPFDRDGTLTDEKFVSSMKKKLGPEVLAHAAQIAVVEKMVRECRARGEDPAKQLPIALQKKQLPLPTWVLNDDRALVLATLKHGLGNHVPMWGDKECDFPCRKAAEAHVSSDALKSNFFAAVGRRAKALFLNIYNGVNVVKPGSLLSSPAKGKAGKDKADKAGKEKGDKGAEAGPSKKRKPAEPVTLDSDSEGEKATPSKKQKAKEKEKEKEKGKDKDKGKEKGKEKEKGKSPKDKEKQKGKEKDPKKEKEREREKDKKKTPEKKDKEKDKEKEKKKATPDKKEKEKKEKEKDKKEKEKEKEKEKKKPPAPVKKPATTADLLKAKSAAASSSSASSSSKLPKPPALPKAPPLPASQQKLEKFFERKKPTREEAPLPPSDPVRVDSETEDESAAAPKKPSTPKAPPPPKKGGTPQASPRGKKEKEREKAESVDDSGSDATTDR